MKKIRKTLRIILKTAGILAIVLPVIVMSIIGLLMYKRYGGRDGFSSRNDKKLHHFKINKEDRLVKGMYIPSKKSAFAFIVTVDGEAFQDCQLIVSTSNGKSNHFEQYSKSNRFFIARGKVDSGEIRLDSYSEENISVVIRAVESDQEPIGDLRVTVR